MTPTSRTRLAGYRPAAAQGSAAIWSSISPVPAVATYACPVWPPPPLPPVSCELQARLEALETQKKVSLDSVREMRLEQLKVDLQSAQASASQCKQLEQQLERSNFDWKEKFNILEARFQQDEAFATRRLEEAEREAEARSREETSLLRAELQAIRSESDRAVEDVQRRGQEEIERLRREVQAARDAEQRSGEEAERREIEIVQLRADLEQQQDVVGRSAEQLRKLERRAQEMNEELERERAAVRQRSLSVQDQRRSYEVELTQTTRDVEDLRVKLRKVIEERDTLESDLQHLSKANAQREEECKQLRASISEERNHVRLLQRELETRKAEVTAAATRAQYDSDTVIARQSISSTDRAAADIARRLGGSSREGGSARVSTVQMIDVDLTDERDLGVGAIAAAAKSSKIRRNSGSGYEEEERTVTKTITVEIDEEVSESVSESSAGGEAMTREQKRLVY